MIAIIDYKAGNLRSVQKACEFLGETAVITSNQADILAADRVILPGVGAFGDCMTRLREDDLETCIHKVAERNTPFLGICLGQHLFFESSEESPGVAGLGILKGKIVKIPKTDGLKIPHMGWNSLSFPKESPLFQNLPANPFVYFVHSYYMEPADKNIIAAVTHYGAELPIAVSSGNLFATQFHPEKSGEVGLQILKNFITYGGKA